MRLIGRLVALLVVAGIVGGIGLFVWRGIAGQMAETAVRAPGVAVSVAYAVPRGTGPGEALRFSVPPHARTLTLLFNAVVPAGLYSPLDEREPLPYRIRVSAPDQPERELAVAGRPVFYGDPAAPRTALSLAEPSREVTFARTFRLSMAERGERIVEISLAEAAPEIAEVLVRAYVPRQLGAAPVEEQWMRLRPASRRELAGHTLYPDTLLTLDERRNLMVNRLMPLGPEGIANRDYSAVTLYRRTDPGLPIRPEAALAGQYADSRIAAAFDTPAGRVAVGALTPDGEAASDAGLTVSWHGPRLGDTRSWTVRPGDVVSVEAGLLTVTADRPVQVEVLVLPDSVAPSAVVRMPAYDLSAGPVMLPVRQAPGDHVLLRLDLRCRCFYPEVQDRATVVVEELDGDGAVVRRSEVVHPIQPARYELISPDPEDRLSARSQHFWRPAPDVAALRLTSAAPVLVSAYNRPGGLPRRNAIPPDPDSRIWFALRPLGETALIVAGRMLPVELRRQPPEADPDILDGRYVYETFVPDGAWLGRTVYHRRDSALEERDEAQAALFSRLPDTSGVEQTVLFEGTGAVIPTLAYYARQSGPMTVEVDGRTVQKIRLRSGVGEISLGRLPTGAHSLRVTAPAGTEVFVNHTAAPADLVRRTALAFRNGRLDLSIPPPPLPALGEGGDVLTLRLFTNPAAPACTVTASLDPSRLAVGGPQASLTIPETIWSIAEPIRSAPAVVATQVHTSVTGFVIGAARPDLAEPARLFLPIGRDADFTSSLPIALGTDCVDALVSVARVTPGAEPRWRLDIGPGSMEN